MRKDDVIPPRIRCGLSSIMISKSGIRTEGHDGHYLALVMGGCFVLRGMNHKIGLVHQKCRNAFQEELSVVLGICMSY